MRVNRPNQTELARTLASAVSSGQAALLPGEMPETVLDIPAQLIPQIEMCRPLRRGTGLVTTAPEEQSIGQAYYNTATNGAPVSATLLTLRAGIWRIYLGAHTVTRTAAAALGARVVLLVGDPAGAHTGLGISLEVGGVAIGVPQRDGTDYLVHLAEDGYTVSVIVDDPAVATSVISVSLHAFACRLV